MKRLSYICNNKAFLTKAILLKFKYIYYNFRNRVSAKWWEVALGKDCSFIGKTTFERFPGSHITIGKNCRFRNKKDSNLSGLFCPCIISTAKNNANITIGDGCGFSGTRIRCGTSITLGNNVRCGANTYIADTDAHSDDYRAGADRPVVIEDNVWLGLNVVVLKGVHIGKNSVIGAGSIVTKDIPANCVAVGTPCKVIKQLKCDEK